MSGGADSLALLHILTLKYSNDCIIPVIVDHGLQEDSADVAKRTAEQINAKYGINCVIKRVKVDEASNVEANARNARYQALFEVCSEAAVDCKNISLYLAHTKNDSAESVLLGLARGSGISAIKGIAEHRTKRIYHNKEEQSGILHTDIILARPFLRNVMREMTEEICHNAGLDYWNDPTNFLRSRSKTLYESVGGHIEASETCKDGQEYSVFDSSVEGNFLRKSQQSTPMRTLIRHKLLPVFESLFPGIKHNLARTALILQLDEDYLENVSQTHFDAVLDAKQSNTLDIFAIKHLHQAIRLRIIRKWIETALQNIEQNNLFQSQNLSKNTPQISFNRILEIDEKLIQNIGIGGNKIEIIKNVNVRRIQKILQINTADINSHDAYTLK